MKRITCLCAAAGWLFAGGNGSLSPRANAADYPAHATAAGATFAAAAVAPEAARKMFGADLNRAGYVLVEVAVYPEPGNRVELSLGDFTLRTESSGSTVRPAASDVIAAAVYPDDSGKPPGIPGKVDVYTESTIGYSTGGNGRRGGVYTGEGVGVGVGNPGGSPPPRGPSKDKERSLLEAALSEKGLPAGKTGHAVAGYLYFPQPASKARNRGYRLTWSSSEGTIRLDLPLARR